MDDAVLGTIGVGGLGDQLGRWLAGDAQAHPASLNSSAGGELVFQHLEQVLVAGGEATLVF